MMRAFYHILLVCTLVLGAASCSNDLDIPVEDPQSQPAGPVTLMASIVNETGTKATLDETAGTFAFSSTDAIKVYNGTGLYVSTGVSINGATATFTMENGFTDTGSGLAAFPASIVDNISAGGVTYTLPASYTYEQVGGSDASAAMVPCPMIASYAAGAKLSFKQAGAVVRFRIANCLAGDLTFTFTTKVTGSVTLATVPSGTGDGILAANLSNGGYSITVTGVPSVNGENYIFITLPVPTGTDPMNVGVWNKGATANNVATLSGTVDALNRAEGYKRGVSLVDVKEVATFNGLYLVGYLHYDGSSTYDILEDQLEVLKYYSVDYTTNKYYFNWNFINDNGFCASTGVSISGKSYRVPTGGATGEWAGIVGTTRGAAIVNGNAVRYSLIRVTGLSSATYHTTSIGGLLLFPDNAIVSIPSDSNISSSITADELTYLVSQGCAFLPTAGYWKEPNLWSREWAGIDEAGSYWSSSKLNSSNAYALTILKDHSTQSDVVDPEAYDVLSTIYYPVRLIRIPAQQ